MDHLLSRALYVVVATAALAAEYRRLGLPRANDDNRRQPRPGLANPAYCGVLWRGGATRLWPLRLDAQCAFPAGF